MKSKTIAAAAILMAAMMVVPIALSVFDDTSDTAADSSGSSGFDPSSIIGMFSGTDFDITKLMSAGDWMEDLLEYEQHTKTAQVLSGTLENNFLLKDDYTVAANGTVTVAAGNTLIICPAQPFSITTTGATFILKEGATLAITSDGQAPSTDNVIYRTTVEDDDEETCFCGTIDNAWTATIDGTKTSISWAATVAKDSYTANTLDATAWRSKTTFVSEAKLAVDATIDMDVTTGAIKANGTVKANIDLKNEEKSLAGSDIETSTIKGNIDYSFNINVPGMSATTTEVTSTYSVKGNAKVTANIQGKLDVTISNNTDASATVVMDATGNMTPSHIDIYNKISVELGNAEFTEDDGATVKISGANASLEVRANDATVGEDKVVNVTINANANLGQFDSLSVDEKTGAIEHTNLSDISANVEYQGTVKDMDPTALAPSAPSSSSSSLLAPSTTPKIGEIISDYLAGAAALSDDDSIYKYAGDFLLGFVDKQLNINTFITTTKIKVNASVGSVTVDNVEIRGLSLNAEISESVGLSVSASASKIVFTTSSSKMVVEPLELTLKTSEDKTKFAVVTISGNIESKQYDGTFLVANSYANGIYVKMTISADTTTKKTTSDLEEMSIGKLVMNSFGIDTIFNNVAYDKDNQWIKADEAAVVGNYYGDAPIKRVDGSYKDVTMMVKDISTMSSMTIGSSDITLTDIDNDTINFKRTCEKDATGAATYTNTITTDGQVSLIAILEDEVLENLLFYTDNTTVGAKEKFNMSGMTTVSGGSVVVVPGSTTYDPVVTVDNGTISIKYVDITTTTGYGELAGDFVGEIYVEGCVNPYTGAYYASYAAFGTTNYELDLRGDILGVTVADDKSMTYSVAAKPGYKLATEGMTTTNITLSDISDKKATATLDGSPIECYAVPEKYSIIIDGTNKGDDFEYGKAVVIENIDATAMFDANGAAIGEIDVVEKTWTYKRVSGTGNLSLTSVKVVAITPSTTELNVTTESAISFTAVKGMKFSMGSGVRFDITDNALGAGKGMNLIAEKTTFEGRDAFLIKAVNEDGNSVSTTLYLPVAGEGQKIMHVDEYGRANELAGTLVKFGEQYYMKTDVYNYSIFYTTEDEPRHDVPGGSGSNVLLFVAIGVAIVVVAAGAFFFIKKH